VKDYFLEKTGQDKRFRDFWVKSKDCRLLLIELKKTILLKMGIRELTGASLILPSLLQGFHVLLQVLVLAPWSLINILRRED